MKATEVKEDEEKDGEVLKSNRLDLRMTLVSKPKL